MKYKVWDKVRIVNERVNFMNSQWKADKHLWTIMTISRITSYYKMKEDWWEWEWNDSCIEWLVNESTHFPKETTATDILNKDIANDFTDSLQSTLYNTIPKPKTTIGNIEQTNNTIETEKYFSDDKNTKSIVKLDKELKELIDVLNRSSSDICSKLNRLSNFRRNLNDKFEYKNLDTIKVILAESKEILEFMNTYNKNSVEDLWKDTEVKEKFDVTKFFN